MVTFHLYYQNPLTSGFKLDIVYGSFGCKLQYFIKNLLTGVHIEEEEQEEEVDNSLRGRLRRLLQKVKKFREKKVELEPEPQEDKKPSESLLSVIQNSITTVFLFFRLILVWRK